MDDICEGWLNRKDKPAVKETHARRIKYITVGENDLLQRMRKFQVNGSSRIHKADMNKPGSTTPKQKQPVV